MSGADLGAECLSAAVYLGKVSSGVEAFGANRAQLEGGRSMRPGSGLSTGDKLEIELTAEHRERKRGAEALKFGTKRWARSLDIEVAGSSGLNISSKAFGILLSISSVGATGSVAYWILCLLAGSGSLRRFSSNGNLPGIVANTARQQISATWDNFMLLFHTRIHGNLMNRGHGAQIWHGDFATTNTIALVHPKSQFRPRD